MKREKHERLTMEAHGSGRGTMHGRGKGYAIGGLLLALALGAGLSGCREGQGRTVGAAAENPQPLVTTVLVQRQRPRLSTDLPAELEPYQDVVLRARVAGFVSRLYVDRGSQVRAGQVLAVIEAPDLVARVGEAQQRLSAARAQRAAARAALIRDQATLDRLTGAARAMPGAVAGNDITVAEQTVRMDAAQVEARTAAEAAAQQAAEALRALQQYLRVRAPFSGMVVTRMTSTGALVGPGGAPMFELQQLDPLRLTVDVPEDEVGGAALGNRVNFRVTNAPGAQFTAAVARIAHSVRPQTRTMPVEADAANPGLVLAPGMFARVRWPIGRPQASLYVPSDAVMDSTAGHAVEVVRGGRIAMVNVTPGYTNGGRMEIFGPLRAGDAVVSPADNGLTAGTKVRVAPAAGQPPH